MSKAIKGYKARFSMRLYELSYAYIEKRKEEIIQKNKDIDEQNRIARQQWKIKHDSLKHFTPVPYIPRYTITRMLKDIENQYNCTVTYRNFNLYTKGTFPDATVIKAFADFFNVSFEYMYGISDEKNPLNRKIQEIIPLSDDSIYTLTNLNQFPETLAVIDALLSDRNNSPYMLMNLYNHMYQTYKKEKLQHHQEELAIEILREKILEAEYFMQYLEKRLLPMAEKDFEARFEDDMNYEDWRENFSDEYIDNIPDFDEPSVTIDDTAPIKEPKITVNTVNITEIKVTPIDPDMVTDEPVKLIFAEAEKEDN